MKFREIIIPEVGKYYEYRDTRLKYKYIIKITEICENGGFYGIIKKDYYYGNDLMGFRLSNTGITKGFKKGTLLKSVDFHEEEEIIPSFYQTLGNQSYSAFTISTDNEGVFYTNSTATLR